MRLSKKSIAGIIAALLAVAVVCGVVVWSVPVFRVSEVKVSGTKELSAEEVEEASGIHHGDNLVRVDVGEAARDVAALPWVASATVSRSFPSSVKVKLTEHTPAAFVKDDGKTRLIDDRGEDFAEGEPPVGAVEITGDTGTPDDSGEDADALHTPEMEEAVAVLAALPDDLRGQVGTLDIEERYSMRLHLRDNRTVYWGADEDNANKARAMAAALQLEGTSFDVSNPELVGAR